MQRTIFAGLKGMFHFKKLMIQKIACVDEVDLEILELLFEAGSARLLPKDFAVRLSQLRVRRARQNLDAYTECLNLGFVFSAFMGKVSNIVVQFLSLVRLPIQVQGILFRKTNGEIRYLLLKRTLEKEGFWQPVTGGLEEGETKVEALKREVWEETGIKNVVGIIEKVDYFEYSDAHFIKGYDFIKEYVFGVEIHPNEKITIDGKEHSQFKWCSFQEALELLKWEENKKALLRLSQILSSQK